MTQVVALQVSGGMAAGSLFAAALGGFVFAVMFWPPIVEWWWRVTAMTRLGLEYLIYGAGLVVLCGGALYLIAKTAF